MINCFLCKKLKYCFNHLVRHYMKWFSLVSVFFLFSGEVTRDPNFALLSIFGWIYLALRWLYLVVSRKMDGMSCGRMVVLFSPFILILSFRAFLMIGFNPERIHFLFASPFYLYELNNLPVDKRNGHTWYWGSSDLAFSPGVTYLLLYEKDSVLPEKYQHLENAVDARRLFGKFFLVRILEGKLHTKECWRFFGCIPLGQVDKNYEIK